MICTADKKNTERCTNEASYGTLCKIHARQLACTPSGFQRRRVLRYRWAVIEMLSVDEEMVAEQIIENLNDICPYDLNHWKVGSLLRAMMKEGTIVRLGTTRMGKSTSVYMLRSQEHETGPTEQGN